VFAGLFVIFFIELLHQFFEGGANGVVIDRGGLTSKSGSRNLLMRVPRVACGGGVRGLDGLSTGIEA
jgi:hypothetical protein